MGRIRRFALVLLALALFGSACALVSGGSDVVTGNKSFDATNSENFCVLKMPPPMDFTVVNEAYEKIRELSIYYYGNGINISTRTLYHAVEKAFWAAFSIPEESIPKWSSQILDEAAESDKVDFMIFEKIFDRAINENPERFSSLQDPFKQEALLEVMINGLLKGLGDDFSNYRPASRLGARGSSLEGGYIGFGFSMDENERGEIKISSVFEGQPAEKAGLLAGDVVLAVDGKSTAACSITAFGNNLIGDAGSSNVLTIRRDTQILELTLTRGRVQQLDVLTWPICELDENRGSSAEDLPFAVPLKDSEGNVVDSILYIRLRSFTEKGGQDLIECLRQIPISSYEDGIILDLRGNGGGLLNVADWIADAFYIGSQPFFRETNRDGETQYRTTDVLTLAGDVPLIVLVGRDPYDQQGSSPNSFSASEMLASTFKDNERALIIGESITGGKGTINRNIPLRGGEYGELYIAIAFFTTNDGTPIQGVDLDGDTFYDTGGIEPNIIVEWTDGDYSKQYRNPNWDPVLFMAIELLQIGLASP